MENFKPNNVNLQRRDAKYAYCKKLLFQQINQNFLKSIKTIYIQQDNAKPHSSENDKDIVAAGSTNGWNIQFKSQPENSSDLNVIDLGFLTLVNHYKMKLRQT